MDYNTKLNQLPNQTKKEIADQLLFIGLEENEIKCLNEVTLNELNRLIQFDITEVLLTI